MLTTILRRLALPLLLFLVWTPVAQAWSWPVQGPVLQGFAYDESHPYASGQHRGIDIGADATGESVVAPAGGTVSFAGTVPTNGKSITIETRDGYSVTLTHLGSLLVGKDATVAEGDAVGTVGPSGTPELDVPYVHLGIRTTADPNGYLDPLTLLPPPTESEPAQSAPPVSQPAASSPAASKPVSPQATAHVSTVAKSRPRPSHVESRPPRPAQRPAVHADVRTSARTPRVRRHSHHGLKSTPQRPVVEVAPRTIRVDLGAGHEIRPSVHALHARRLRASTPSVLPALVSNGAAALVALLAAAAAGRRRRRASEAGAEVLHLPRPQPVRRAA
jgi:hypothetical protein